MNRTINFDYQTGPVAVEIRNEPLVYLLALEMPSIKAIGGGNIVVHTKQ
jgi:hypothetical protein